MLEKIQNGELIFLPNFFKKEVADEYMDSFEKNILWKQEEMVIYGNKIKFPRLTAWYGEENKPYTFSGLTLHPEIWTNELLTLKNIIEPIAETTFNSVLLNQYRDGQDSISWHSDNEKELGKNPIIASVNFGESRRFLLKHILTKEKLEFNLEHGSLLIMKGEMQHFWKHSVPKTKKDKKTRINLTYRQII